jgi:Holliday junction resolvase
LPARSNNYKRGAAFERTVKHWLEEREYYVIRAAGSKGPADLWAIAPREKLILVQCKIDGKLSHDETDVLINIGDHVGARPVLAAKGKRGKVLMYWIKPLDGGAVYEEWDYDG